MGRGISQPLERNAMERKGAERSGGLHKPKARKTGETPCAARSGQSPLAAFAFAVAFQKIRGGVAGKNETVTKLETG
jgi:hypothetical protein